MLNLKLDEATFLESVKFHKENNIGMRGYADGNKEEQLTGIIGQNIICLYLGKPFMISNYLFCSYHKKDKVLTVCGWIDKKGFKDKAKFYKEGEVRTRSNGTDFITKADLYEIENKDLNDVNDYKDLLSVGIKV